jgi:hypothetical protein
VKVPETMVPAAGELMEMVGGVVSATHLWQAVPFAPAAAGAATASRRTPPVASTDTAFAQRPSVRNDIEISGSADYAV